MSAVKIDMSGLKVSGNASVLNNMKVSGKNNSVKLGVRKSELNHNASVLNNLDVQNGELTVDISDVKLGKDAKFMNNRTVREKEQAEQSVSTYSTRTEERDKKNKDIKKGIIKSILSKLMGGESENSEPTFESKRDEHIRFVAELSKDGTLGQQINVETYEMKEKENNRETEERDEEEYEQEPIY